MSLFRRRHHCEACRAFTGGRPGEHALSCATFPRATRGHLSARTGGVPCVLCEVVTRYMPGAWTVVMWGDSGG